MQTISFDTINAFIGLGTISIYMIAYFGHLAIAFFLKIFKCITGEKFIKQ